MPNRLPEHLLHGLLAMSLTLLCRLELLITLEEALACGSIGHAAIRLGIDRGEMDWRLGEIEGLYETSLFVRVGDRLVPTEFGAALLTRLGKLLEQSEDFFRGLPVPDEDI